MNILVILLRICVKFRVYYHNYLMVFKFKNYTKNPQIKIKMRVCILVVSVYFMATAEISTFTFLGKQATCTVSLAGAVASLK